jgi:hypothetical protein
VTHETNESLAVAATGSMAAASEHSPSGRTGQRGDSSSQHESDGAQQRLDAQDVAGLMQRRSARQTMRNHMGESVARAPGAPDRELQIIDCA